MDLVCLSFRSWVCAVEKTPETVFLINSPFIPVFQSTECSYHSDQKRYN